MNKRLLGCIIFICIITIVLLFISFTTGSKNQINKDYPGLTDVSSKVIIEYTNSKDVINNLENNYTGIIVYGFKRCPWCQQALPYINEIAIQKGYKEVLYLDIYEMRNNVESPLHDDYLTIFNIIKISIGNPEKIFAPTITVMDNGEIKAYSVGTIPEHVKNDNNVLPPLTSEQIEKLRILYKEMF